jgi:hypothetical protein
MYPQHREMLRMIMYTVGRGGQGDVGQRIRDEILVIQASLFNDFYYLSDLLRKKYMILHEYCSLICSSEAVFIVEKQ